ncbi:gliding motility-associated C-terminal domain-containing protein [Flavobacterium kingsejongi]|uniref:Ig-like domain-containing protein n=1 Tax=Flavobacterium kingsejongi TaxID=1678728 RepID=A0A2S1LK71_9FLAO|nr:gliding motility-associated C-terminal domain-containing protein [Flavobacterium kingsejongi]AWG24164.1 hypothetical protein FK004_02465 [Flavobacterium kingsejongi]
MSLVGKRPSVASDIQVAPQAICPGGTATLTASSTTVINNPVIKWYSDAALGAANELYTGAVYEPSPTINTTYYVTIQSPGACENVPGAAQTVNVSLNRTATAADIDPLPNYTICPGITGYFGATSPTVTNPVFTWYDDAALTTVLQNGPEFEASPIVTTTYYLTVKGDGVCENVVGDAYEITVTVNPNPPTPIGNATQSFCEGATVANLVTNATTIMWYDAATAGMLLAPTTVLVDGQTYYGAAVENAICESEVRLAVTVNITAVPPTPTGDAAQTFCAESRVSDLVTNETGVVWYTVATGGTPVTPTTLLTNTTYYGELQSGSCVSPTRLEVVVTLTPRAISTDITASTIYVCVGEYGRFEASTTTVSNPVFRWYQSAGSNTYILVGTGPVFIPPDPANLTINEYYRITVSGDDKCESRIGGGSSGVVSRQVKRSQAAAGDIEVDDQSICRGQTATLAITAPTITYGTIKVYSDPELTNLLFTSIRTAPTYPTVTYTTPVLTMDTKFYVTVNSDGYCENVAGDAHPVTITIANAGTPEAADVNICAGDLVTLTASMTTPITNPAYTWYSDPILTTVVATTADFTPTPALETTTTYYVTVTGDGTCEDTPGPAKEVNVIVPPKEPTPTGDPVQTFCSYAVFWQININSSFYFRWYDTPTGGTPLDVNGNVVGGTTYYAAQFNPFGPCENESDRLPVLVQITPDAEIPVFALGDFSEACPGSTVTYTATSVNSTSLTYSLRPPEAGTIDPDTGTVTWNPDYSGISATIEAEAIGCSTPVYGMHNVTMIDRELNFEPTQTFCAGATVANLVTDAVSVIWYDAPVSGTPYDPATPLVDGQTYYGIAIENSVCAREVPISVVVTLTPIADAPIVAVPELYFCTGTGVRFTATSPLTNPVFTWYDDAALTNVVSTYSYLTTPALTVNTTYYVTVKNTDTCESPAVTVQAIAAERPLASDIITQNSVQVCDIPLPSTVTLTATVASEFTNVYWYSNAGLTNLVNTGTDFTIPVAFGQATRSYWVATTRTGNSNCQNSPAEAQRVDVYVLPAYQPDRITVTGNRPLCLGETQELVATATIDTGTETGIKWYNDPSLDPAFLVHDGANFTPVLTETTTFYVQLIGYAYCPNQPNNGKVVAVIVNPQPGDATGMLDQQFCTGGRVSDLVADQAGIVWYAAETGGTALNATTVLVSGNTYYGAIRQGSCESLNRLPVTVTINRTATAADITQVFDHTVCSGIGLEMIANTTTVTNPVYTWYSDPTLSTVVSTTAYFGTPLLTDNTAYYVTIQGDGVCENTPATAKVVTITVSPLVAPPTGAATQTFCTGATVSDLVTTEPNVVWFSNDTGGASLPGTTLLVDTTTYYGALIDSGTGCESATRLAVQVQLTPDVTTPVFALGATSSVCAGATETYTATAANSTGMTYNLTPSVAGIIDPATGLVSWEIGFSGTATITAEAAGCNGPTNAVHTVTVIDPAAVPVFDLGPTSEICGDPVPLAQPYTAVDPYGRTITYTMSPTGNGIGDIVSTTGTIVWATYGSTVGNYWFPGGEVTVTATVMGCNGPISATHIINKQRKADTIYLKGRGPSAPTPISSVCQGTVTSMMYGVTSRRGGTIIYSMTPPEAGTIATLPFEDFPPYGLESPGEITWNPDYYGPATVTGTVYGCDGVNSTASTVITVRARVDSVAFDLGATSSICAGATQLYYAVGNNEVPVGNNYTITPASAGTITSLVNGATIRWNTAFSGEAVITATATGCNGSVAGTHTVTVIPLPGAPTGATTQTFCAAAAPTVAQLLATGNNIQWYTANVGGTLLDPATALVDTNFYYASQTDPVTGCESTARLAVRASLTAAPGLPTGASPQLFCAADAPTVADLVTSPTNVVWYDAAVGGNLLPDTTLLTDGTPYYAAQLLTGCESVNRLQVVANFKPLAENFTDIDIQETPIYVCDGEYGTFSASSTTVINPVFRWYEFGIGGALLHTGPEFTPPDPATITKQWIVTVAGDNKCEALNSSQTKTVVRVYMRNPDANAITAADQAICSGTTASVPITIDSAIIVPTTRVYTTADLDPANKIAEFTAHSNPAIFTTPVLTATTTYYITTSGPSYCESKPSNAKVLTITVHDIATPTTGDPTQEFCVVSAATIADLQVNQTNIVWYDAATAGNSLPVTTVLADGGHYFAALTDVSGCESTVRLDIEVILTDTPAPTAVSPQRFCSGYGFTIGDIVVTGTNVLFYSTSTGGTPLDPTAAVNQRIYYASQTIGGCESSGRTYIQVYIIPTANETMIQSDPVPPVCYGASADLSVRSNFVTSPKFKWYTDNTLAFLLHTGPDYTTPPILTTTSFFVTVQDTVASLCENIPGRAFELVVNVKPYAVAADITASGASICRGTATTLVASSAIPNAIFKWYSDPALTLEIPADGSDPTGATLTVSPIAATTYYATVLGDGYCENEPNTGKDVTVNVTDIATPTTGDPIQEFCVINAPTIADLQVDQTTIVWYDAATAGNSLPVTTALADGGHYFAALTDVGGCESTVRLDIEVILNDAATPTTTDTTQEFCVINAPTVADLQVNETNITWYDLPTGGTIVPPTTALTDGGIYYASLTDANGCESSVRLAITVILNDAATPTTADTTQEFCVINGPTVADLQVNETNVTWYDLPTGGTIIAPTTALTDGGIYYASLTDASGCESSVRLAITVILNDAATPTTPDTTQEFCVINAPTVADLQVNETNVTWYDLPTGGTIVPPTTALTDAGIYYASLTDASGCASSVRLAITVILNDAATPTTTDTTQEFCVINAPTVANLQVNETNVTWYDLPTGGTIIAPTTALTDAGIYYASLTDANGCESSVRLVITVILNDAATPTTTDPTQEFCVINAPTVADLQVNETNVTWYDALTGGTIVPLTTALTDNGIYYASLTDANGCASSVRLAITVILNDAATPTTPDLTQEFCVINAPTVANLQVNETNVTWYNLPTGGTILPPTTALTDGAIYYASLTDASGCASSVRLAITVILNDAPTPTTTDLTQEFCVINAPTVADLQVNETNITWYDLPTGGTIVPPTTALTDGGIYYASLTDANGCASSVRLAITVILNDAATPTTPDLTQEFCVINAPTVANLQVNETNVTWYNLPTGGTILPPTTALTDGAIYYASLTDASGCASSVRLAITVILNDAATPTTTDLTQEFCVINAPTVADLQVNETNVTWYNLPTGGTIVPPTTALTDGGIYYASLTDANGCASSVRLAITVILNDAATPTTPDPTQEFCVINAPTVADLQVNETNITWYDLPTGGTIVPPTTALTDGGIYYASLTDASGCESSVRLAITVILNDAPTPTTTDLTQEFCVINTPTVADLQVNETNVTWYDLPTGGTIIAPTTALTDGGIYYASLTDASGCESSVRLAITVILNDAATPTTPDPTQEFCVINVPTVANLQVNETNVTWYTASTGGTIVPPTTALTDGAIYYASLTDASGCESSIRLAITVILNDAPTPTTPDLTQEFCVINVPTVANLQVNETNVTWYNLPTGGTILPPTTALTDGGIYYASLTDASGCESSVRLAITVILNDAAPPTGATTQSFCTATIPTVANLVATGDAIQWYASATGGVALDPATVVVQGATYYASQTAGGCESTQRLAVMVTLTPAAWAALIGVDPVTICVDETAVLTASTLVPNPVFTWYADSNLMTVLGTGAQLTVSPVVTTAYYVTVAGDGYCENTPGTAQTATVTVNRKATAADITIADRYVCTGDTVLLTASGTVVSPVYTWYSDPELTQLVHTGATYSVAPATTVTYYIAVSGYDVCINDPYTGKPITLTVAHVPTPTTNDPIQSFCGIDNPTVADLQVNATNFNWYATPTGGNPLPLNQLLTDGTVYYATESDLVSGCESEIRLEVTAVLRTDLPGDTSGWNPEACVLETVTYTTVAGMSDYVWFISGGTILSGGQLTDNYVTVQWITAGAGTVSVAYINAANCDPIVEITFGVTITLCGDIAITKTVDASSTVAVGDTVVFTIAATNLGTVAFTDVVINETLPDGYTFVQAFTTGGSYNPLTGLWTIAQLEGGETLTLKVTAIVKGSGDYLNVAYLESSFPEDPNPDNNRDEATITVSGIVIYNGLSPNGDGQNDYFNIEGLERYPNNSVEIFNRYGARIYHTNGYHTNGNVFRGISEGKGTISKGEVVPAGTYFYILKYETPHGGTVERSGYLYVTP